MQWEQGIPGLHFLYDEQFCDESSQEGKGWSIRVPGICKVKLTSSAIIPGHLSRQVALVASIAIF